MLTNLLVSRRIAQSLGRQLATRMHDHVIAHRPRLGRAAGARAARRRSGSRSSCSSATRTTGSWPGPARSTCRSCSATRPSRPAWTRSGVRRARAVAVLTSNDLANIETGARGRRPARRAARRRAGRAARVRPRPRRTRSRPSFGLPLRPLDGRAGRAVVRRRGARAGHPHDVLRRPAADADRPADRGRGRRAARARRWPSCRRRIRVIAISRRESAGVLEYPPRRDTRFDGGDQAYLVGPYEELLQVLRRDAAAPSHRGEYGFGADVGHSARRTADGEGPDMAKTVLVTGASGFVGSHLDPRPGRRRARRPGDDPPPRQLRGAGKAVAGDVADPESLRRAARPGWTSPTTSCTPSDSDDFERQDADAARNFAAAAAERPACGGSSTSAGWATTTPSCPRTCARAARSRSCCAETGVPVTVLRAAVVIGHGGISWEITRQLVDHLPLMITPKWVKTRTQPIALPDVVRYLVGVLDHPDAEGRVFEIGGPDVLRYIDMLERAATRRGQAAAERRRPAAHPAPVVGVARPRHRRRPARPRATWSTR